MPGDRGWGDDGERIAKLEAWRDETGEHLRRRLDDHDKRLGALERFKAYLFGVAAVFGVLAQAVKQKLGW